MIKNENQIITRVSSTDALKYIDKYGNTVAEAQLLGGLMKNPSRILDYSIQPDSDFQWAFHKVLFHAIREQGRNGSAKIILPEDIDNYFAKNPANKAVYDRYGGSNYVSTMYTDAVERKVSVLRKGEDSAVEVQEDNFDVNYDEVRKWSLLRDFVRNGFDVSDYYVPSDLVSPDESNKIAKQRETRFATDSIQDMIQNIHNKVSSISSRFEDSDDEETLILGEEGTWERILERQKGYEYGLGRPSQYFTTVTSGLRGGRYTVYSSPSGTGKSRTQIATMCFPYLPCFYNQKTKQWEDNPNGKYNRALYICTEMKAREEIEPIFLAYMTGISSEKFIGENAKLSPDELKIAKEAQERLHNSDKLFIKYMPGVTIASLKSRVAYYVANYRITALFFDYIGQSTELDSEYARIAGKMATRSDLMLANMSRELKKLSEKFHIAVETATQITGDVSDSHNRGVNLVRGSKAIIDKADVAVIMSRPSNQEKKRFPEIFYEIYGRYPTEEESPTLIYTVYKNRGARWVNLKIWLRIEYDTMRFHDLFVTDLDDNPEPFADLKKTYTQSVQKDGKTMIQPINSDNYNEVCVEIGNVEGVKSARKDAFSTEKISSRRNERKKLKSMTMFETNASENNVNREKLIVEVSE